VTCRTAALHAFALGWLDRYAGSGRDSGRENTRREYRRLLATFALRYFDRDVRLRDLDRPAVQRFVDWLASQPGRNGVPSGLEAPAADAMGPHVVGWGAPSRPGAAPARDRGASRSAHRCGLSWSARIAEPNLPRSAGPVTVIATSRVDRGSSRSGSADGDGDDRLDRMQRPGADLLGRGRALPERQLVPTCGQRPAHMRHVEVVASWRWSNSRRSRGCRGRPPTASQVSSRPTDCSKARDAAAPSTQVIPPGVLVLARPNRPRQTATNPQPGRRVRPSDFRIGADK
jgi:hypothetical protein